MSDWESMHAAEVSKLSEMPPEHITLAAAPKPGELKLPVAAAAWINVLIAMFGPMAPGALLSICDKPLGRQLTWDGAETWQEKHPKA